MATTDITVNGDEIHAEIKDGNRTMLSNTSIILDPLTCSYSTIGILCKYNLTIENIIGLTESVILLNGKNSRFSTNGSGSCDIKLMVEDDNNNNDTTTITITVL